MNFETKHEKEVFDQKLTCQTMMIILIISLLKQNKIKIFISRRKRPTIKNNYFTEHETASATQCFTLAKGNYSGILYSDCFDKDNYLGTFQLQ